MDTHSTLRSHSRLVPCIFFTGWIITSYLGFWQLPQPVSWPVYLLLVPVFFFLLQPIRQLSILLGSTMMGFATFVLLGYLYQLKEVHADAVSGLEFLGVGLMILTGMTMAYWCLFPVIDRPSPKI